MCCKRCSRWQNEVSESWLDYLYCRLSWQIGKHCTWKGGKSFCEEELDLWGSLKSATCITNSWISPYCLGTSFYKHLKWTNHIIICSNGLCHPGIGNEICLLFLHAPRENFYSTLALILLLTSVASSSCYAVCNDKGRQNDIIWMTDLLYFGHQLGSYLLIFPLLQLHGVNRSTYSNNIKVREWTRSLWSVGQYIPTS